MPDKRFIAVLAAGLIAGCGGMDSVRNLWPFGERSGGEAPRIPADVTVYDCDGGKQLLVRYSADRGYAMILLPEREFRLDGVPAGSGAKYSNGRTVLSTKGEEASVEEGGSAIFANCKLKAAG